MDTLTDWLGHSLFSFQARKQNSEDKGGIYLAQPPTCPKHRVGKGENEMRWFSQGNVSTLTYSN